MNNLAQTTNAALNAAIASGSNSAELIKDLNDQLRELGRESITSQLAKPKMALAIYEAAVKGLINEDDAEATYDQYVAGQAYSKARNSMAAGDDNNSIKANVSKNRQIIKAGSLPIANDDNTTALLDRVTDLRKAAFDGDQKVKPAFDCFVDVCRVQLSKPKELLTDEEITAAVVKAEKADKTDLDRMCDEYKRLYNLVNGTKNDPGIPECEPSMRALGDAIVGLGGDIPPMTKEEKKEAEAIAFMKANPSMVSRLIPAPLPVAIDTPAAE